MRRLLLPALALLVAIGFAAKAHADDQAKAIVEKAIKAHGGQDLLDKYKGGHTKSKGKLELLGGIEFTQEVHYAYPDKFKEIAEFEIMGMKIRTEAIVNGDKTLLKVNGNEMDFPDSAKAAMKEGGHLLQVMRLSSILTKEFKLATVGEVKVEGKPALGVKVSKEGQKDIDLFFDKESHLIVKVERKGTNPTDGQEVNEERIITEYKKTGAVPEVKKLIIKHDGKPYLELEVLESKMLEKVDENEFSIP